MRFDATSIICWCITLASLGCQTGVGGPYDAFAVPGRVPSGLMGDMTPSLLCTRAAAGNA